MNTYEVIVVLHVAFGAVALATYWTAGLVKKGTPLHRRVGQVYLLAMLAIVLTGIPLVLQVGARGHPCQRAQKHRRSSEAARNQERAPPQLRSRQAHAAPRGVDGRGARARKGGRFFMPRRLAAPR